MNILTVIILVISASTAEDLHSNTQNKEREIALEENSINSTAQERIDQDAVPSCISKITSDYAQNTAPSFYNPLNYGKFVEAVPIQDHQRNQHRDDIRHNSGVGLVSSNFVNDQLEDRKSGASLGHAKRSYSSMIVNIGSSGENSNDNKLSVSYGKGGVALSFSGNERAVEMVLSPPPSVMSQFLAHKVIDQHVSVPVSQTVHIPITRFARVPVPYAVSILRSLPDLATQTSPNPNIGHAPVTVNRPTPILMLHPVTMPLPEPYGIPVPGQVRQPVSVSVPQPNVMQKSQSFMSPAGERAWYKEMTTPVSAQHTYSSQVYQAISKHRSAERDTYKTETGISGMSESYLQLIMGSMPHNLGFNFNSLG